VADAFAIVREGVRAVVAGAGGITVVGEAATGTAALELVERRRPDLLLIDARMPGVDGIEVTRRLAARHSGTRVVIFTAAEEQELLWEALEAGARGYVLKDAGGDDLVAALRRVTAGDPYVDPRLAPDLLRPLTRARPTDVLSAREREVLQMLADGLSNREVSERLVLSIETVKTHVKHILVKLNAEHRTQAVAIALRQSMIT
jgi:DNA-binding NarL/FixJ family response regulator